MLYIVRSYADHRAVLIAFFQRRLAIRAAQPTRLRRTALSMTARGVSRPTVRGGNA